MLQAVLEPIGLIVPLRLKPPEARRALDFGHWVIVIDHDAVAGQLDSFIKSLQASDFFFDEAALRDAVDKKQLFQLIDSVEALKLDLYPRELVPGELDRSSTIELFDGLSVPIASLPDTAISKLIWISKGSHKGRRDLRQLIRITTKSQR